MRARVAGPRTGGGSEATVGPTTMAAFDGGAFIWGASRDAASGWIHSSMVIRGRGVIIQLQDARLRRHEGGPRRQLCLLVRSDAACRHGGLRGARDPRLEPTGLTGDSGKPGLRQGPEAWGLRGGLANRLTLRSRRVRPPDGSTVGGGGPCLGGSNAGPAFTLLPALARRRSGDRRFMRWPDVSCCLVCCGHHRLCSTRGSVVVVDSGVER